ncbi:ACP S-malonyltransferase [Derxia lacustris]|uniref:ACP S-malonyltransferase n=1 Tax=Derxia lacustris TaxID=764842 RepID=UPI000A172E82|nr:acyltransferase domain-containing protein [Derxia lacustris]
MSRLAILCPGQAGQQPGMLDALMTAPDLAALRDAASAALGEDVARWWAGLDAAALYRNGPAQFAIAFFQLAAWARLGPLLPAPALVAGYSLGELVAYHVAGALDAAETLHLVRLRARFMDEAAAALEPASDAPRLLLWRGPRARAGEARLHAALAEAGAAVSIHRPGGELVIGGPPAALAALLAAPGLPPGHLHPVRVGVPSHTRWLAPAAAAFRAALESSALAAPRCPVLAGIDGRRVQTRAAAIDTLAAQIAAPLRWDICNDALAEAGIDRALELGPGSDLSRLAGGVIGGDAARSAGDFRAPAAVAAWVAG